MIRTVGDLIGALQHHSNSQLVKVNNNQPIIQVQAQNSTAIVRIYTGQVPNPPPAAVVGSGVDAATLAAPLHMLEED